MFRKAGYFCLLSFGLASASCAAETVERIPDGGPGNNPDGGPIAGEDGGSTVNPPAVTASEKANLRFKRNTRLRNDVAQALALPEAQVCTELGEFHCTDFVHAIALGGVEAYTLGLNVPFDGTTATTPVAVERVALFACGRRVDLDLADRDNAVIYRDLTIDGEGRLTDISANAVTTAIRTMYERALLRPPTESELSLHRQLYRDIEADAEAAAARDWAVLSCFTVLTSMESLFY